MPTLSPSKLLQILTGSEYRKALIFFIEESPRTLAEINSHYKVKSPEIQPRLKEMEAANLIVKKDGAYQSTLFGKVLSSYYKPFLDTLTAIESNETFWNDHDLSAIPEELLYRIQELKDCTVVETENHNLFEPHKEFEELVLNSSHFKGAACIFIPSWIELFLNRSYQGIEIEIILTDGILNKIKSEHPKELDKLLRNNARLYICKEHFNAAFATTDQYFSLALHTKSGNFYDHKNDLMGNDSAAVKWGESLFEYYKEKSVEVEYSKINELVYHSEKIIACKGVKR